jgi:pyruvate/2-oxoglutarate dehydrogenase complex dihydrolipoamide acyltransferase (E2) component
VKLQAEVMSLKALVSRLKEYEKEAREEILQLQTYIRKQRTLTNLKAVTTKEQHMFKVDNLKG